MDALQHFFGFRGGEGNGGFYLFWSGIAAFLVFLPNTIANVRKHNCHQHRCWRFQRRPHIGEDGREHWYCNVHHPHLPPGHPEA